MSKNKKLSPELLAFVSGIAKFINETDAKKAGVPKNKTGTPANGEKLNMNTEEHNEAE